MKDTNTYRQGRIVRHRVPIKGKRGNILQLNSSRTIATVQWNTCEEEDVPVQDLRTIDSSFKKGDLVIYNPRIGFENTSNVKDGAFGVITKVYRKSVFVYWTKLNEVKNHNTSTIFCYVDKVTKQGI